MHDVKLFGSRLSPFVEKVARALQVKSVPFELIPPASPADFRRWNPQTRKMPVLEVAGERIADSTFILRRLEAIRPEPALYDADPQIAAHQCLLEDWSDEALYWYGMALRWSDTNTAASTAQILGALPAFVRPVAGLLIPRQLRRAVWAQGLGRLHVETVVQEVARRLSEILVFLGDRPFLFRDRVGAADLAIFGQCAMLRSGPTPQAERVISGMPGLLRYLDRIEAATGGPS